MKLESIPSLGRGILRPHKEQQRLWNALTNQIFYLTVIACGRRSGKTEIIKRFIVKTALSPLKRPYPYNDVTEPYIIVVAAPTYRQVKRVFWKHLLKMIPKEFLACKPDGSDLKITTIFGHEIYLIGLDRIGIQGIYADLIIVDEADDVRTAGFWEDELEPMLGTYGGRGVIMGVPNGTSGILYKKALQTRRDFSTILYNPNLDLTDPLVQQLVGIDPKGERPPLGGLFHWTSEDILDKRFIERVKATADSYSYQVEYLAKFVNSSSTVYYSFDPDVHIHTEAIYKEDYPIILAFDFNVAPGAACLLQEHHRTANNARDGGTVQFGEVFIERGATTLQICEEIFKFPEVKNHRGEFYLEGDPSGGNKGTAKIAGSDWDLIKEFFHNKVPGRCISRVARGGQPPERAKIVASNSRLKAIDGTVRYIVHPRCTQSILDWQEVKRDANGFIDKRDMSRTHWSDAMGYYFQREFPLIMSLSNYGVSSTNV